MTDQWKQKLRDIITGFEDASTDEILIFVHSELEKVRQETRKECFDKLPKYDYLQYEIQQIPYYNFSDGWTSTQQAISFTLEKVEEALSINKKEL